MRLDAIGIMSAMPQEADLILDAMTEKESVRIGKREFTIGRFEGVPVVFVESGIGKVAAAATATLLIAHFGVQELIFTGAAGGGKEVQIGDVVVGDLYLQHDLDLRPIFPRFYIYGLEKQLLEANEDLIDKLKVAAEEFLGEGFCVPELGVLTPKVHKGAIISGDQFIGSKEQHMNISAAVQEVLPNGFHAVEMEGAAVTQVCTELQTPFVVLRSVSDKADAEAGVDFTAFIDRVASRYSLGILRRYFQNEKLSVN